MPENDVNIPINNNLKNHLDNLWKNKSLKFEYIAFLEEFLSNRSSTHALENITEYQFLVYCFIWVCKLVDSGSDKDLDPDVLELGLTMHSSYIINSYDVPL